MLRTGQTRVLLADDQAKVRSALRLLLEQEPGLSVVGDAVETEELLAQAEALCPDLMLLDWELPGLQTADPLRALRAGCPNLKVIAVSGRPEARRASLAGGWGRRFCQQRGPAGAVDSSRERLQTPAMRASEGRDEHDRPVVATEVTSFASTTTEVVQAIKSVPMVISS
jgi:CheY-like chemotaxis protein